MSDWELRCWAHVSLVKSYDEDKSFAPLPWQSCMSYQSTKTWSRSHRLRNDIFRNISFWASRIIIWSDTGWFHQNVWTVPPRCLSSKQSNFSNLFISDGKFVNSKGKKQNYKLQRLDLRRGMTMMTTMYQLIVCPWPDSVQAWKGN